VMGFMTCLVPVGFLVLSGYLYARSRGWEWIRRVQPLSVATWEAIDIVRVSILFISLFCALLMLQGGLVQMGLIAEEDMNMRMSIINALIMDISIGLLIFIFARRGSIRQTLSNVGLSLKKIPQSILLGFIGYLCVLPIFSMLLFLVIAVSQAIGYDPPAHPLVTTLVTDETSATHLVSIILGALVGPFFEELFFRGFCYTVLRKHYGVWMGILISSALFSCVHWNAFSAFPILFLGMGLAYLYEKTGKTEQAFKEAGHVHVNNTITKVNASHPVQKPAIKYGAFILHPPP